MISRTPLCIRILFALAFAAVFLAACSDNADVGGGVNANGGGSGNLSIGEETTTTTPAPLATAPPTTAKAAVTTAAPKPTTPPTTAAPTTTTAPAADNSFVITINGDNSQAPQFDPPAAAVAVGSVVKFVNADVKPRSVVAQSGAFRSPEIPPGGNWKYKATTPGEYNYQDGTRPYAVGRLEVR